MGNKQTTIKPLKPLNDICPISLNIINKGIILECKHQYSILSIQRYCLDYIIKKKTAPCPICKNNINYKKIKKIYNNWILLQNIYDNWEQNNILLYNNLKSRYIDINIIKNTDQTHIIIPLFNINKINQSCMIKSPTLKKLIIYDNKLLSNKTNNNKKTIYNEELDKFTLCFKSKYKYNQDSYYFNNLIKKIITNSKIKKLNKKINFNNILKRDIIFFIDNQKNVTTYDYKEGTMENNFFYKIHECKIMFSSYILIDKEKSYLINKIHSIIYY